MSKYVGKMKEVPVDFNATALEIHKNVEPLQGR